MELLTVAAHVPSKLDENCKLTNELFSLKTNFLAQ